MRASTLASVLVGAGAVILLVGIVLKSSYIPVIGLLLIIAGGAKVNAEKKAYAQKQEEEKKELEAAAAAQEAGTAEESGDAGSAEPSARTEPDAEDPGPAETAEDRDS